MTTVCVCSFHFNRTKSKRNKNCMGPTEKNGEPGTVRKRKPSAESGPSSKPKSESLRQGLLSQRRLRMLAHPMDSLQTDMRYVDKRLVARYSSASNPPLTPLQLGIIPRQPGRSLPESGPHQWQRQTDGYRGS